MTRSQDTRKWIIESNCIHHHCHIKQHRADNCDDFAQRVPNATMNLISIFMDQHSNSLTARPQTSVHYSQTVPKFITMVLVALIWIMTAKTVRSLTNKGNPPVISALSVCVCTCGLCVWCVSANKVFI